MSGPNIVPIVRKLGLEERGRCEADCTDPGHAAWKQYVQKDVRCSTLASYVVDGTRLCRRHASLQCLDALAASPPAAVYCAPCGKEHGFPPCQPV